MSSDKKPVFFVEKKLAKLERESQEELWTRYAVEEDQNHQHQEMN